MKRLIVFMFSFIVSLSVFGQAQRLHQLNLDRFSSRPKVYSDEYKNFLYPGFVHHPDAGYLPFKSPPVSNCFELLEKRNAFNRYFLVDGSQGSHYFQQQSESSINYIDTNGFWREINYRLKPDASSSGKFVADEQPTPFFFDLTNKQFSVRNNSYVLEFAKGLELLVRDQSGVEHSLGVANWSDVSTGDDGILIHNFYPTIDAVFSLKQGEVEISFILNRPLSFSTGELIMRQNFSMSNGLVIKTTGLPTHTDLDIVNESGDNEFTVEKSFAFDDAGKIVPLLSSIHGNQLDILTSLRFINDPATVYPVVIDPIITTGNSLPVISITGSQYNPVCFTGGCLYNLNVSTPNNATVTNMYFSFEYYAVTNLCMAQDGGFQLGYNGCTAPAAGAYTCPVNISNINCSYVNTNIPEVVSCFPAPSCNAQVLPFTLEFFRCNNDPSAGCSANCIRASQPWIMTIEGNTLDINNITPATQSCQGNSVPLNVIPEYGVAPYSFLWTNGALTDTTTVTPLVPTSYTVTVTDACNVTATGSVTVTPDPNNNPGFSISPNPVCEGSSVSLIGGGAGLVTAYDWTIPGAGLPGNVVTDTQNPTVQYSIAGNYSITLNYKNGNCRFDSTLSITVTQPNPVQVSLAANPSGISCSGVPITYTATPVNGGPGPQYVWLVDGVQAQSGSSNLYTSSSLSNGALVQVILIGNAACTNPVRDTASLFAAVNTVSAASVSLNSSPATCEGDTITFTANPTNGGPAPVYQWFVNNVAVGGAGPTYVSSTILNGDVVKVILTSNLACVNPSTSADSVTISLIPRVIPDVRITSAISDSICPGQLFIVNAAIVNTIANANYSWFVNSIPVQNNTTSAFSSSTLRNGDIIQVVAAITGQCINAAVDTSNIIRVISYPPIAVQLNLPPTLCKGVPIALNAIAIGGKGDYRYTWSVSVADTENIEITLDTTQLVSVIVNDECSLVPGKDSVLISILPGPHADFIYENPAPLSFTNTIQFTNESTNFNSWLWIFKDSLVTTTALNPVHQFTSPGEYDVTLVTQSPNGCIDSITYRIVIVEDVAIYLPNSFTPDGNGINDLFTPIGASLHHFNMIIYNRWGEIVYEGDDQAWNGLDQHTSKPAPQAVYVYRIDFKDSKADKQVVTGRVTLIR